MSVVDDAIHVENVTAWMAERLPNLAPPLSFDLIAGGHSNLTFGVNDTAGGEWVLRRPPLRQVLATAHDMGREHKVMSALGGSNVPVPTMVGFCDDESVNQRPFYVMDRVQGHVWRNTREAEKFPIEARKHSADSLMDTLAALHAVDPDEVGLGDLGKKEDYIARQLKRWKRQFDESKTTDRPQMDEIHSMLVSNIPDQGKAGIVHGDYRLDNCIVDDAGEVQAVLDWELCTLGDVKSDVAQVICYWARDPEDGTALKHAPTLADGFPEVDYLIERYSQSSDRDLSNIDYYIAFGYWRLACIIEGVYSRYVSGAMGDHQPAGGVENFLVQIEALIASSTKYANRAS